jgi:hypothetical protein
MGRTGGRASWNRSSEGPEVVHHNLLGVVRDEHHDDVCIGVCERAGYTLMGWGKRGKLKRG